MKKQDLYLIAGILLLALVVFAGYRFLNRGEALEVVVRVGEEEYARLPLKKDAELSIEGKDGGENMLVIRNGEADIIEASCPDKLCVHQKAVSEKGESLICMPHQVIVSIE